MAKDGIADWDSTAANNTDMGGISIQGTAPVSNFDGALRELMAQVADWTDSDTVVSASTTNLGSVDGMYVTVSGTATITSFGTLKAGMVKFLRFSGAGQITHNATSMILPGGANITRADGDTAIFVSEGSGNWRCLDYQGSITVFSGGTWTPTLTGITNVASTTSGVCHYMRVGNYVQCWGTIIIDPTDTATQTIVSISLPIASAFTVEADCGGVGGSPFTSSNSVARIYAHDSSDTARLVFAAVTTSAHTFGFQFGYVIK